MAEKSKWFLMHDAWELITQDQKIFLWIFLKLHGLAVPSPESLNFIITIVGMSDLVTYHISKITTQGCRDRITIVLKTRLMMIYFNVSRINMTIHWKIQT